MKRCDKNDQQAPGYRNVPQDLKSWTPGGAAGAADHGAGGARDGDGFAPGFAALIERLNATNDELLKQVAELSRRNYELTLFNSMSEVLQSSATESDAYSVIADTASRLFPDDSGAVFVLNAPPSVSGAAAVWGARPPVAANFRLQECLAYRNGAANQAVSCDTSCPNAPGDRQPHDCVPLLARDEMVGVLHLIDESVRSNGAAEEQVATKREAARRLADNIALALCNLRSRETLRNLSIRDPLTGLFNRRYMDEALTQEQHRTVRNKAEFAVVMMDIDNFRQFNDDFGHDCGDAVLVALGELFRNEARASDIACRYGGEEFILILSPANAEGALRHAERIRDEVGHLSVRHSDRDLGAITLSLGVAVFPGHASDAAALVKAADVALYQAKNSGRNRVVMFAEQAGQRGHGKGGAPAPGPFNARFNAPLR